AVYAAIRTSSAIQNSTFLGIQLGQRSTLIVILVVAVSILQSWLMQKQMPSTPGNEKAGQTSQVMFWMNPILFGWMTWTTDAGLGLYFLAGAVFMIGQQLYTNHVVKPKIQEIIDQDMANVQATPRRPRKDVTAQATKEANRNRLVPTKESVGAAGSKRRNAGKQTRR
ncbi:MAG: YidC/Oxa1 family membrane protein insertase, partial [Abiotrophia defectiva]|nr:YidC/Oxa1 family membrane protein insertase [Abiotrophia defectiva]